MIVHDLVASKVLNLNIVSPFRFIPDRAYDLVLCLDVFVETIFACEVVEIGEDLFRAGIYSGPIDLRLERPCVGV